MPLHTDGVRQLGPSDQYSIRCAFVSLSAPVSQHRGCRPTAEYYFTETKLCALINTITNTCLRAKEVKAGVTVINYRLSSGFVEMKGSTVRMRHKPGSGFAKKFESLVSWQLLNHEMPPIMNNIFRHLVNWSCLNDVSMATESLQVMSNPFTKDYISDFRHFLLPLSSETFVSVKKVCCSLV